MCARLQWQDLQGDVRQFRPGNQMFKLLAHDLRAADRAHQHRFVEDAPEMDRVVLSEQLLSGQSNSYPVLDLLKGRFRPAGPNETSRVVGDLQQTRYALRFI